MQNQKFTIAETVELLKCIFSLRHENLLEPELFERIRGSPNVERFSEEELKNRFNQLKTEGSLLRYCQRLSVAGRTWFQETYEVINGWTEEQELALLEEIFHHRNYFETSEMWQAIRLGNVGGLLANFSKTQLEKCFKRLRQSHKIDILSAQMTAEMQNFYADYLLAAPAENIAAPLRQREGWTGADDKRLLDLVCSLEQPRFRFITDLHLFPGKTRADVKARFIDMLLDGHFVGILGKSANHHREKKNGARRKGRDPFTEDETEELKKLHKLFSVELKNESPWIYIWLTCERIISSRTTVDIKDKFRVLYGARKGGYDAVKRYFQQNGYTWTPPPTTKRIRRN